MSLLQCIFFWSQHLRRLQENKRKHQNYEVDYAMPTYKMYWTSAVNCLYTVIL